MILALLLSGTLMTAEPPAILDDPARHLAMSAAARALGRPAAADAVAEVVMAAGERRPLPDRDAVDRISRGVAP